MKEAIDKRKFENEHKSDSPVGFDTYQSLLKMARENTGKIEEDEED